MNLCVNSDLFKSNNDIKVVTKMLDTYDSMSTKSQSAEALVTIPSTVVREGHKATQVALSPSQTESHTPSAPPWVLQSTGRGAEWDSVYMRFAQYLSTKEQQEVGLLTSMVNRWRQLGLSTTAVSTILEGHQIPFRDGITPPYTGQVSSQFGDCVETEALSKELEGLLAKGVVELVPPRLVDEGYYNPCFLVRENQDISRPTLNLKALNKFVTRGTNEFGMSTANALSTMVQPGDWLSSIDLKDPFHHIPVAEVDRKYFRFRFGESCYQYTRLPWGYALSHQTFTRCLKAALVVLLRKGIRLAWNRGVLLVVSSSYDQSIQHTGELMEYLEYVGFTIDL